MPEPEPEAGAVRDDAVAVTPGAAVAVAPSLPQRATAEAIGTFALVAVGPGAAMVAARTGAFGHAGVALAFGLVVAVVVAASGHLSGAHINPAVTLGFWSRGRFPAHEVPAYVVAQCAGAIAAALALGWVVGGEGMSAATLPALPLARAFAVEAGFTALLGFVIAGAATDDRAPEAAAPFAIGATVFAGARVCGPLTGGSFNPARTLGPAIAFGAWQAHWLYWVAPVAGMLAGMRAYDAVRGD